MRAPHRHLAAVLLLAAAAHATVIVYETLEEMTKSAGLVVRGRVTRVVQGFDNEKNRIWTWSELAVIETIKGEAPAVVLMKQPGGEAEGWGQHVAGTAKFTEGEECVVFLEAARDEPGAYRVYGMSAGKISLQTHEGKRAALRDTRDIGFAVRGTARPPPEGGLELLGTPEALIARLRTAAGGSR